MLSSILSRTDIVGSKSPLEIIVKDKLQIINNVAINPVALERKSPAELVKMGADQELVNSLYQKIKNNEYKRRQAAPGLRVSSKAFGTGRRVPIVNHYRGQ